MAVLIRHADAAGQEGNMERFNDNRTGEETETHTILIGGVDTFLSGWGPPKYHGVKSRAYWACRPEGVEHVWAWVESREEFPNVEVRVPGKRDPYLYLTGTTRMADFVTIYVVRENHPALRPKLDQE